MKRNDDKEVLEAIGDLRDLMVEKFEQVEGRLDRFEYNQNIHTNVLDKHTKMLIDLKHEQIFALNRTKRIEKDVLMIKKKLKAV